MSENSEQGPESLNDAQARRLSVSCRYIDGLLSDVEGILNAAASKAAFPRYAPDISPAQRRTIEDYIARIRAQLARVLAGQGIPQEAPQIPSTRAVRAALGSIEIAVEELKPKYMRGYGPLPAAIATELNGIVGELEGLVSRMARFLAQGPGADLRARLERLAQTGDELALLGRLEQVVAQHGLVEYRAPIAGILDRLEDNSFEIAVFGRVSSGKSSLLDAILETSVLPVGITPITAVPTRIAYGAEPRVTVRFVERGAETVEAGRLAEFATEQQNSGNRKSVAGIRVELPAPRLEGGVSFMDTPGLGSLATAGAAETIAYLPKCDLGVVLIDSASTLTPDDLRTIEALLEAAVPAEVLLSKSDLVSPGDRARLVEYVQQHLEAEFHMPFAVYPLSALPAHRESLERWFTERIAPLCAGSREMKAASVKRKIGALAEAVAAALQMRLGRGRGITSREQERARAAEARLRTATGRLEEMRVTCDRACAAILEKREEALEEAAARLVGLEEAEARAASAELNQALTGSVQQRVCRLHEELRSLAAALAGELGAAAQELGVPGAPAVDEFESLLRETPVFEFEKPLELPRATIAGLFGKAAARRGVARRLASRIGAEWEQSLRTYFALLRSWCERAIEQLKRRFDSYAEGYRAQAERALSGRELTGEEERAIVSDLEALGARPTAAQGSGQVVLRSGTAGAHGRHAA